MTINLLPTPAASAALGTALLASNSSTVAMASLLMLPALCVFIFFSSRRPDRQSASLLLPSVSLLLVPLCFQIFSVVLRLLEAFADIAQQKATGVLAVYSVLIEVQRSTLLQLGEIAIGLILLALVAFLRTRGTVAPPPMPDVSEGGRQQGFDWTVIFTVVLIMATTLLFWSGADMMHILNQVLDPTQSAALITRFGSSNIGGLASYISNRLLMQAGAAVVLAGLLLTVGIIALTVYRPRRYDARLSGGLALLLLLALGAATLQTAMSLGHMQGEVNTIKQKVERQQDSEN